MQPKGWDAVMAFKAEDNLQTPCPSCEHGTGHLTGVRVERAL